MPFCVQYSFSLNGIIKEKKIRHNITVTWQTVEFARRKTHDAVGLFKVRILNARMNFRRGKIIDHAYINSLVLYRIDPTNLRL